MKKILLLNLLIFSIFVMFFITSCSDSTSSDENETLKVYLTDALSSYDAVNITFSEVNVYIKSDWITVVDDQLTANLHDYNHGKTTDLRGITYRMRII
ncbi:MAG: DUF4382 domain-containing protein [Bacteroidota bacterium]